MSQTLDRDMEVGRRRLPRRVYECPVGILRQGHYKEMRCHLVGEGGMVISSSDTLVEGDLVLCSFFLNAKVMVIVRGAVRSITLDTQTKEPRYGLEFLNLGFQYKREIRNFVAAATRVEGTLHSSHTS